jgi:hypothetical protein
MVAQVDEEEPAMIAHAVHPAGEADASADVVLAKRAAIVSAIEVHGPESERAVPRAEWKIAAEQRMGGPYCQGERIPP